jgi:DNA-binding CsgD family transcriptional regulator/DNA-binding transcriptional regulator GbsR (MarR family)
VDDFDLDADAEAVYRSMIANPTMSASDMTRKLGLSHEQVRSALDRLSELTLLRKSLETGSDLRPVSPEVGFHAFLQRQQAELADRYDQFVRNQAVVARLLAEYTTLTSSVPPVSTERIEGLDRVQNRTEALVQRVRTEFLALVPGGPQRPEHILASKPLDAAMIGRGVVMRSIYVDSLKNDPATFQHVRWLAGLGVQVRTTASLPLRLLLADRAVALVPIDPEHSARGAIQCTEPGVIAALVALFEQTWSLAVPFGADETPDRNELSRRERELLHLLAHGATDEGAARRLGVSVRTVRRMVSGLMDRLDAHSRFEAGLRAAERGWLSE